MQRNLSSGNKNSPELLVRRQAVVIRQNIMNSNTTEILGVFVIDMFHNAVGR